MMFLALMIAWASLSVGLGLIVGLMGRKWGDE